MQLLDHRIDVPDGNRDFPAYLDSNRFLSNLPGTTILFPVVDLSRQYINGMMYLLTQPEGARPTIVDDRNFYRPAGVKKWVKNGFLNKDIKLPLGTIWRDAHADRGRPAAAEPDADRRRDGARRLDPRLDRAARPARRPEVPRARTARCSASTGRRRSWKLADILRWQVPLPRYANLRAQPRRAAAQGRAPDQGDVPAELRHAWPRPSTRWSPTSSARDGIYADEALFERIYKGEFGAQYLEEASNYSADVIACTRDICTYIYETHGRFPAHCDTIHVPGVWLQAHHVEKRYYEKFFRHGLTEAHRAARRALALGRLISPGLSPRAV